VGVQQLEATVLLLMDS